MPRPELIDPRLLTGLANITRVRILGVLLREPSSPSALRKEIAGGSLSLDTISYHLKVLRGLQLVELVAEQKHGNLKAKVFGLSSRPFLTGDDWRRADLPELVKRFFGGLADDLGTALLHDAFAKSPSLLQRAVIRLDEIGQEEVNRALADAEDTIQKAQVESDQRAAKDDHPRKEAQVVVLAFPLDR